MDKSYRPEWVPQEAGDVFATRVMGGIKSSHDGLPNSGGLKPSSSVAGRKKLTVDDYVRGVLAGDRTVLARAITLVESNSAAHFQEAQQVLKNVLPYTGKSIRVGITGVPGAGKSTFIEALGCRLCERGHKVAVLAVDPSSTVTKGSILGDKTRMEMLSRNPSAFIRPSPSGGTLGGVARKSRETLLLCEAAGYDVILVETVGVGQSETTVRSMVDFFLLIVLTGAGDELQGMKKGVMELADAILINKADGDNRQRALMTRAEYDRILHYLRPATENWLTKAYTCSSVTGEGIDEIWEVIEHFRQCTADNGIFEQRRKKQALEWMYTMLYDHLRTIFFNHPGVSRRRESIEHQVISGTLPVTSAVQELLAIFGDGKFL